MPARDKLASDSLFIGARFLFALSTRLLPRFFAPWTIPASLMPAIFSFTLASLPVLIGVSPLACAWSFIEFS